MTLIWLLVAANTINIAAVGEAIRLLIGDSLALYVLGFGALCIVMQLCLTYERSVRVVKWLTLALFAYVAVILNLNIPWKQVFSESIHPQHTMLTLVESTMLLR